MARGKLQRDPKRELYWLKKIEAWQRSEQSVSGFCRQEGVAYSTFQWWKAELKRRGRWPEAGTLTRASLPCDSTGRPAFVPIEIFPTASKPLILEISGRYRVEVARGFDPQTLCALLEVLEGRGC